MVELKSDLLALAEEAHRFAHTEEKPPMLVPKVEQMAHFSSLRLVSDTASGRDHTVAVERDGLCQHTEAPCSVVTVNHACAAFASSHDSFHCWKGVKLGPLRDSTPPKSNELAVQ